MRLYDDISKIPTNNINEIKNKGKEKKILNQTSQKMCE